MLLALLAYNALWFWVHSINALVLAFQVNFVCLLVSVFLCMVRSPQVYFQLKVGDHISLLFLRLYIAATVSAFVFWLTDSHLCSALSTLPVNPQFHSWWHVCCAVSSHSSLMFEVLLKSRKLKRRLKVDGEFLLTLQEAGRQGNRQ